MAEHKIASQEFWHVTGVAGEPDHIIYPFFATMKVVPKGLPPAEESQLPSVATEIYSGQWFTVAAKG